MNTSVALRLIPPHKPLPPHAPLLPLDKAEMETLLHRVLDTSEHNAEKLAMISVKQDGLAVQLAAQGEQLKLLQAEQQDQAGVLAEYKMFRRVGLGFLATFLAILTAVVGTTAASWISHKIGWK